MRSYHPDRNPSAEAAARVRAITEAYKTIGDPASRAEYDASRWERQFEILGYDEEPTPPRRQSLKAPAIRSPRAQVVGAVTASGLAIVVAAMVLPGSQGGQADLARHQTAETSTRKPPVSQVAPAKPPEPSPLVAATPPEASPSASPAVLIPAGKALADSSEPARAMAGPDPVKADASAPRRTARAASPPAAGQAGPAKAAPVDEKARIAALEAMSTSFYNQSVNHADGAKRQELQQARELFIAARNACRSDECVGNSHANYIRDISLIVQKPKPTP
jgi:hypothetical protein